MPGKIDYNEAWLNVKGLIDAGYEHFPRHQGTTDVSEVVEFARIANDYDLSDKEYDQLIARGERYLADLYRGKTPAQLEAKYGLTSSARWTTTQKRKQVKRKSTHISP